MATQTFREQTAQQGHPEVKDLSNSRDAVNAGGILYHVGCADVVRDDPDARTVVAAPGDRCGKCGKFFGEGFQLEAEAQRAARKEAAEAKQKVEEETRARKAGKPVTLGNKLTQGTPAAPRSVPIHSGRRG